MVKEKDEDKDFLPFFFLSITYEHGLMKVTEKTNNLTKHYRER
jgi:hypothetical protein